MPFDNPVIIVTPLAAEVAACVARELGGRVLVGHGTLSLLWCVARRGSRAAALIVGRECMAARLFRWLNADGHILYMFALADVPTDETRLPDYVNRTVMPIMGFTPLATAWGKEDAV